MNEPLKPSLEIFSNAETLDCLRKIKRGLEREALRVCPAGTPSRQPHPPALGAALTHTQITTDFSEALLEFVSPVATGVQSLLQKLGEIHAVSRRALPEGEYLWAASMPPHLYVEQDMPIASYGSSHSGQIKQLYRKGLAKRYGRQMQMIAGIHYNFSMPEEFWDLCAEHFAGKTRQEIANSGYFALMRNCRRHAWLLVYLFGASPVVSADFLKNRTHDLQSLPCGDFGLPGATSLRTGKLGYQSEKQQALRICANSLEEYSMHLCQAIFHSLPEYEAIGLEKNGELLQMNTGVLQIENEYYGIVRPKRSVPSGTAPLLGLMQEGVEYVELRCVDVDPYEPFGITADTMHFLDSFLLYCLLLPSPPEDEAEEREAINNIYRTVESGRDPGFALQHKNTVRPMREWGMQAMAGICEVAALLDRALGGDSHQRACQHQLQKIENAEYTPAAHILEDMQEKQQNFFDFAREHSLRHAEYFAAMELEPQVLREFEELSRHSLDQKKMREKQNQGEFSAYLQNYYDGYRKLCPY